MDLTRSDVYVPVREPGAVGAGGRVPGAAVWPPTVYSPGRQARDRALARELRDALGGAAGGAGDVVATVARRPGLLRRLARRGADEAAGQGCDAVVAVEGPGLLLAVPLAMEAELPLIVLRRSAHGARGASARPAGQGSGGGLAPAADAPGPGRRVLLVDALLGEGDDMAAAADLVEEAGARVAGIAVIAEVDTGGDRPRLSSYNTLSLLRL